MAELELPDRYEPLAQLGKGGGGEVWAVRDRHSGRKFALKVLAVGASEREMSALVREAVALSGLEGLGVPRVVRFGRLPRSGRAFLVRELVDGQSLEEIMAEGASSRALSALSRAADQLTVLHRAGLFHGDVKPANIVVELGGRATFVDLGLAAPFREAGARAEGLAPRYAAPELFHGAPLTVRAEVYALGVTLAEIVSESRHSDLNPEVLRELMTVAKRAMLAQPADRYPSVDEFASALRRVAGMPASADSGTDEAALWPVAGIDATSAQLLERVNALLPGQRLRIVGAPGSGRTALLRRVAWSLGVLGSSLAWIEDVSSASSLRAELAAHPSLHGVCVLVDDADALTAESVAKLADALAQGARLVTVGGGALGAEALAAETLDFVVPSLDEHAAIDLLRRAVPSLTASLLKRVFLVSGGRPGELRRLVRIIASQAVASEDDLERVLGSVDVRSVLPPDPLERAVYFLDRGRFNDAKSALHALSADERIPVVIARARLRLGLGDASGARALLSEQSATHSSPDERLAVSLYLGRSEVGVGEYQRALQILEPLLRQPPPTSTEALSYRGLALSMLGKHDEARAALELALSESLVNHAPRLEALALASLGLVLQRCDRNDEAGEAYRKAISAAERASDAGVLATVQLNLAGLLKIRGDIAGAIEHFEAAVDMGRRSGRRSSVLQALLNLANTDLYLGRLARARGSIEPLQEQRDELSAVMRAQLLGLEAELELRQGNGESAVQKFGACAHAYEALDRSVDAAEARLEGVLAATRTPRPDLIALRASLSRAEAELGGASAHRSLLLLASARLKNLLGDELGARGNLDDSLQAARAAAQKDWVWRALEARAELEEAGGQPLLARRDREEALAVLEEIGARLPRDLREVYWNDARRRTLRASVPAAIGVAATEFLPFSALRGGVPLASRSANTLHPSTSASISQLSSTPLEQRLARILEVNSRLVGELDLARLTERVTDYAVELARAEHGFVLLKQPSGALTVHTSRSRAGDAAHAEFSRSIAETVVAKREPVLTMNAQSDARMQGYASVHQMNLESVVCVPILAPAGEAIGALYLETRLRPGAHFERELPTLRAFADQVAIALENARLINENKQRADALASANGALEEAQDRLRELLDGRTEQLKRTRQKLRDAREALYGHFGYQGLVGTSEPMRRVYALIERVRDTDVPVLITGESGTGKEVVARAIHSASARSKARTLGVNCGAIPENLLESELFGHVKGAFTGADRDRKGLFRDCQGGTILLDEIGETPLKMQAGLLRVLQERRVRPVGGNREEDIDVRLLFATNRDLSQMVAEGKFREDLYYRIHVVELRVPALRERPEDIPQLVDHFLGLFAARYKREKNGLSKDALARLAHYSWPGNVRQLENVLLNAWVMSEDLELGASDFDIPDGWVSPGTVEQHAPREREREAAPRAAPPVKRKSGVSEHRREERDRIMAALRDSNWNRVKAAEISGIPRRTFYRRLREYGIQ